MIAPWIRDAPLRRKLTGLTLVVSGVALTVALVAFLAFQMRVSRSMAARDLAALAEVVAANAAGPIAFHDTEAARTTLSTLRARPDIVRARLADPTGNTIVETVAASDAPGFRPPGGDADYRIDGIHIFATKPVAFDQEQLGTLELTANFRPTLVRHARAAGGVLVVILAAALLLAYALTRRWQRVLTTPLSTLATTARQIAAARDYSLRAIKHGDDEIGRLTDDFNVMLGEIQTRDLALSSAEKAASEQVVALQREVVERQRTEAELHLAKNAAEAANRAKSSFLAAMSHEIRTPMNGVLGMSNLLLDTPLSREQREFARVIHSSGETLLNLLNDILDFSKIEAGRIEFEETAFDLRELVEDTMELQLVAASAKGLDLVVDLDPTLPTAVRGDPHRLRQVLTNLLGNAVKFTAAGRVAVRVALQNQTDDRTVYRIEVSDTGVGIKPAMQARLFQPFVQADSSTTRKFGGTGLGLAISKRLVELMQGTIGVKSAPGAGATFWFEISLARQPSGSNATTWESFPDVRVLLAMDGPDERRRLAGQLQLWGLVPLVAESAAAALELLQTEIAADRPVQLAMLDLTLPESEMLTLAQRVGESGASARPRPVIVLSALEARIPATAWHEHHITDSLTKPVRTRALHQAITCALHDAPLSETPSAESVPFPSGIDHGNESGAIRALLVEDHLVNQRIARLYLQRFGCSVHLALNGREAISRLVASTYDVVFMDCQMPEMDGFEATRLIRANESSGIWQDRPRAYIVAMTANAMHGDREHCLAAGMDDYIAKPFKPESVERVLRHLRGSAKAAES